MLVGDHNAFSGTGNRIGIVQRSGDALSHAAILLDVPDPVSIVASPFDDLALVTSAEGSAIFILEATTSGPRPIAVRGEVTYTGGGPSLPAHAVVVSRGALAGLVLVAEYRGLRRIELAADGAVTDLGLMSLGGGADVVGAVGVQP